MAVDAASVLGGAIAVQLDRIREAIRSQPFQPFTVRMVDGVT